MKVRDKLVIALFALFVAYSIGSYALQNRLVLSEFLHIEERQAASDLMRCREAFARELEHLAVKARDWASSDATYAFVADRNEAFVHSNLKDDVFKASDVHLLVVIDKGRRVVWSEARDTDYATPLRLARFPTDRFRDDDDLLREKPHVAVALTERGPLLVATSPIVTSDDAEHSRGWFVLGRFLSAESLGRIRAQTRLDFLVHALDGGVQPDRVVAARAQLASPEATFQQSPGDDVRLVYGYAPDSNGQLLLEVRHPRDVSQQGTATVRLTMLSWATAAALVALLVIVLVQLIIIGPVNRLAQRAADIGRTGDLTRRINSERGDEIGDLAREFDGMVSNLRDLNGKLVESSRNAGMADVARGILHNVGNVLNSLNVSTVTLTEAMHGSKLGGVARAVELMDRHRDHLAEFMSTDERGKNLMPYLRELSKTLCAEQSAFLRELGDLKVSVDHVNQVVRSQEGFARLGSFAEPASLREIVASAIAIMDPGLKRHGIHVRTDLQDFPTTLLDTSKCTQVLINLLTNAKDAVGNNPQDEKLIQVRLRRVSDEQATVEVADNGIGIAPENVDRVFENGFTTKAGGRGFGLHYCALAAQEMGGRLTVQSAGLGRGARFTLTLTLKALVPEAVG